MPDKKEQIKAAAHEIQEALLEFVRAIFDLEQTGHKVEFPLTVEYHESSDYFNSHSERLGDLRPRNFRPEKKPVSLTRRQVKAKNLPVRLDDIAHKAIVESHAACHLNCCHTLRGVGFRFKLDGRDTHLMHKMSFAIFEYRQVAPPEGEPASLEEYVESIKGK